MHLTIRYGKTRETQGREGITKRSNEVTRNRVLNGKKKLKGQKFGKFQVHMITRRRKGPDSIHFFFSFRSPKFSTL